MTRTTYFEASLYLESLSFYLVFFLKIHLIFRVVFKPMLIAFQLTSVFPNLVPPELECQLIRQLIL